MHVPWYIFLLLSAVDVVHSAAPSTVNNIDSPDPQRLPLTRLQCQCRFVRDRIKAVPILSPLPQVATSVSLLQMGSRTRKRRLRHMNTGRSGPPSVADKGPDRLECGCRAVKVEVRPISSSTASTHDGALSREGEAGAN